MSFVERLEATQSNGFPSFRVPEAPNSVGRAAIITPRYGGYPCTDTNRSENDGYARAVTHLEVAQGPTNRIFSGPSAIQVLSATFGYSDASL